MKRVVLVTGANRGIGLEICRQLGAAGYAVVLTARDAEKGARASKTLRKEGIEAHCQTLDVTRPDSARQVAAFVAGELGRLDALVNNASTFTTSPLGSTTPALWEEVFASNARAPFFLAQAAMPHLRASHGAIVNITDIYGERPLRQHAVYCMAKAALLMMTRSLALELGPQVRVNAVSPGAILWPQDSGDTAAQEAMLARTPLGRTGTPQEVAEAVRWLLLDARYSTGQVLHLDGGRLLNA